MRVPDQLDVLKQVLKVHMINIFWVNPTPVRQTVEGGVRHHEEPLGRQELRYEEEGLALKSKIRQS